MATKMTPKGVLAAAAGETEEPGEAMENETPAQEGAEEAGGLPEGAGPGQEDGPGVGVGGEQPVDPRLIELSNLTIARVRQAMAATGSELATALKADPVQGAVEIGAGALREVVNAAQEAGKPLPFEVILVAGMQSLKDLAALASELGYLPDEQIETFLKEGFQQSVRAYAQMDMQDGLIDDAMLQEVQQKVGAAGAQSMAGGEGVLARSAQGG